MKRVALYYPWIYVRSGVERTILELVRRSRHLYEVYAQDLKQFALIQMNMGREVCRRLREADNRLFGARMGTEADIGQILLADWNVAPTFQKTKRPS